MNNYITPQQYLARLKGLLEKEILKIKEQKNILAKSQEFESATLYRDIEKKVAGLLKELNFSKKD